MAKKILIIEDDSNTLSSVGVIYFMNDNDILEILFGLKNKWGTIV
jgi:hypothetical protein